MKCLVPAFGNDDLWQKSFFKSRIFEREALSNMQQIFFGIAKQGNFN